MDEKLSIIRPTLSMSRHSGAETKKKFIYSQAKTRFFWSQTIEGHTVHFNNTPFTVSAIRKLDCQFGKQYYKKHPGKSDRTRLQGTRKIGCQAHITVHTITLSPDFQLPEWGICQLGPRN